MYGHIVEINSKKEKAFTGVRFPGLLYLKNLYTKGVLIMLSHNIFYVGTRQDEILGTVAIAGKQSANTNLCGLVARFDTFNICKTYKDACYLANFWNECYKANGKQK